MFSRESGASLERRVDFSSCSETEDGDSSDFPSDYEQASPPSGNVSPAGHGDTEDIEAGDGLSSSTNLPPEILSSLRSLLLDCPGSSFPYLSTAASVLVPTYYLHDDPSLAIPLGLVSLALAARYYRAHRDREALRADDARRRWRMFRRARSNGGADGGNASSADVALEALELLAQLPGGPSRRAEILARAARDPRSESKILLELARSVRLRRLCTICGSFAAVALALLCWTTLMESWPVMILGLLLARDARAAWSLESDTDCLVDGLFAMATDDAGDADVAGGYGQSADADGAAGGIGFGEVCDASDLCAYTRSGKSWVISPLFDKLRERPSGIGGERKVKPRRDSSLASSGNRRSDSARSARRRRRKGGGSAGKAGVV